MEIFRVVVVGSSVAYRWNGHRVESKLWLVGVVVDHGRMWHWMEDADIVHWVDCSYGYWMWTVVMDGTPFIYKRRFRGAVVAIGL